MIFEKLRLLHTKESKRQANKLTKALKKMLRKRIFKPFTEIYELA
jgi:hypothetical protein